MRTRPLYTPCKLYIDGLPGIQPGDGIETEGGSAYLVQKVRPSPSKPHRRYLTCLRWDKGDWLPHQRVFTLTWYKRPPRRARRLSDLAA